MDLLGIVVRKVLLLIIPFLIALILTVQFAPEFTYLSFFILAAGLYVLLRQMAEKIEFLCPECGKIFKTSATAFFFSPHQTYYKLLKCPECNKVSWCIAKYYDGVELRAKVRKIKEKEISVKSLIVQLAVIASSYVVFLASWILTDVKDLVLFSSSTLFFILFSSFFAYAIKQEYRSQIYYVLTFFGVFVMLLLSFLQVVASLSCSF
ncbi:MULTISPECIES: hypothetical protein [unclassified Archaeoglobus]|mgnify:CR=1 FL=1|uniref:hypothetical protein n=1 Tax=unclassified Archaeoglobus TaxID=2643606 RepID=UPI0025BF46E7|nr:MULTISPECIES: hypothetical protein [unclassified Archaeoglobus]